jgi:hypothetical protein
MECRKRLFADVHRVFVRNSMQCPYRTICERLVLGCKTCITVTKSNTLPHCERWHMERSLRSNIDIGIVELCTCVSGDALAFLKLIQLSRIA